MQFTVVPNGVQLLLGAEITDGGGLLRIGQITDGVFTSEVTGPGGSVFETVLYDFETGEGNHIVGLGTPSVCEWDISSTDQPDVSLP